MLPFDGVDDPVAFEDDEIAWVDEIAANVRAQLARGAPFVVQDRMSEIFGRALGIARSTHVRKAVKRLYAEGVTATDGRGDVQRMVIRPMQSGPAI